VSTAIHPLDFEELAPELREALRPRQQRLGYLGDFFRYTAHQPEALLAFTTFTETLRDALPEDVGSLVALTLARRTGNRYEQNQHERLAVARGLAVAWIGDVLQLRPDAASSLTQPQRAVQRLCLAMAEDFGRDAEAPLAGVVELLGERDAVGVLLLGGRYLAHAAIANALRLEPPVAAVLETR
jgi:alkylhydroperoxidase family enzyme